MADEILTEDDGDEEIVAVEVDAKGERIPAEGEEPEPKPKPKDEAEGEGDDDDDDDDHEDERLAESQDDLDDDITKKRNREKRARRRELQKRAREHQEQELARLGQTNQLLLQRLQALEGHTVGREVQTLEAQYAQATREIAQAEKIIAAATTAGNGDDVVTAIKIRDEVIGRAQGIAAQHAELTRKPEPEPQQQERQQPSDTRVKSYGQEWMRANPWYQPNSADEDSAIVDGIDAAMTRQGLDPTSRGYWEELTRRVAARIGGNPDADDDNGGHVNQRDQRAAPRRGPPTGNTRGDATVKTRREVVVTPERKAAMQEAGVWDDPVARARYLKSYQAYDKQNSAR